METCNCLEVIYHKLVSSSSTGVTIKPVEVTWPSLRHNFVFIHLSCGFPRRGGATPNPPVLFSATTSSDCPLPKATASLPFLLPQPWSLHSTYRLSFFTGAGRGGTSMIRSGAQLETGGPPFGSVDCECKGMWMAQGDLGRAL